MEDATRRRLRNEVKHSRQPQSEAGSCRIRISISD
jgi:hypothetical protein